MASRKESKPSLDDLTRAELLDVAKKASVIGRSRMRKEQLKKALKKIPGVERLLRRFGRKPSGAGGTETGSASARAGSAQASSQDASAGPAASGVRAPTPQAERASGVAGGESARRATDDRGVAGRTAPPATRFASGEPSSRTSQMSSEQTTLQTTLGGRLVLMVIDPFSAFAYWEVPTKAVQQARGWLGDQSAVLLLRFYELSVVGPQGRRTGQSFDVEIPTEAGNHYLNVWEPGRSLVAELGLRNSSGSFLALIRSNEIELPRNSESDVYTEEYRDLAGVLSSRWRPRRQVAEGEVYTDEDLHPPIAEAALPPTAYNAPPLYARPGGRRSAGVIGRSLGDGPLELPEKWKWEFGLSSAELAGSGSTVSSHEFASEWGKHGFARQEGEVVVRGAVEPGTDLVIDGVSVPVNPDGSFRLRVGADGRVARCNEADRKGEAGPGERRDPAGETGAECDREGEASPSRVPVSSTV